MALEIGGTKIGQIGLFSHSIVMTKFIYVLFNNSKSFIYDIFFCFCLLHQILWQQCYTLFDLTIK
ncbi:hypothetical protein DERP_000308 [Dermatophagoides pteronyssinus]|uniref:Uncharacterized protein n=1 Tax=Dermatophagoides pteronyssinus TaxID=6956 RepID=A0ABQ8J0D9_DERPT|nr:hypothetical protein DERP_000308 [Dermatophagoides pteronyssinus]